VSRTILPATIPPERRRPATGFAGRFTKASLTVRAAAVFLAGVLVVGVGLLECSA
jgi:hypothetical protein